MNIGNIFLFMDVKKSMSFCKNLSFCIPLEDPYRMTLKVLHNNYFIDIHISFYSLIKYKNFVTEIVKNYT